MDTTFRQKFNKETASLKNIIDQMKATDIYRALCPTAKEYILLSITNRTFSMINHMLDYKTSLDKDRRLEIIPNVFFDHSEMKVGTNRRKKLGKFRIMWKLNSTLLNSFLTIGSKKK